MADMTNEFTNGVLRVKWDDDARVMSTYDDKGAQTSQRAYTADENRQADARVALSSAVINKDALLVKAANALSVNATFLAIASPTTAQAVTQVKALTRQVNAIIKLLVNDLSNTDNT